MIRAGPVLRTMATPRWDLFAAVVVLAVLALVSLSAASARLIAGDGTSTGGDPDEAPDDHPSGDAADGAKQELGRGRNPADDGARPRPTPAVPSGVALLANVALTHGLLAVTVVVLAWISRVPPSALGLGGLAEASVGADVAAGVGLGVGLYLTSEVGTAAADRLGVEYDEHLRELLSPDGPAEWALLLLVILPIVAGAEELLFRAALIGALGAGFGVPTWLLVVGSSILFGAGHGAQGALGIAVTAALGLVLGAAFVLTGSLLVVVLAHYLVNALEFVVREGVLG